jgi:hypothetical protein
MAVVYSDYIYRSYKPTYGWRSELLSYPVTINNTDLNDTGFDNINLKIDISKNKIEIPCIAYTPVMNILKDKHAYPEKHPETQVLMPLFNNSFQHGSYGVNTNKIVKSATPLLKYLLIDASSSNAIIAKCNISDIVYYGGRGTLFYKDMEPMLMFTMVLNYENSDKKYHLVNPNIRINENVFLREDCLSKHIRTKMLGKICEINVLGCLPYLSVPDSVIVNRGVIDHPKFNIIIDDSLNDWIDRPTIPDINTSNEALNEFILDNFTENDL